MRIAYFDCFSGISGDMILGALLDAGLSFKLFEKSLQSLAIKGYNITVQQVTKSRFAATKVIVNVTEEQPHRHLADIAVIIQASHLSTLIKKKALDVFANLAKAEARVHHTVKEKIHFHEVGAVDAIVDVVGAIIGLELLGVEKVVSSSISLGTGSVKSQHGEIPIPSPATVELLKGKPVRLTGIDAELTTPTGAALISTLADGFGESPCLQIQSIGHGAGGRDLRERPNILRVFIGDTEAEIKHDQVIVIDTNIDDMNPEVLAYTTQKLFDAGALDVFLTPVIMKKGRPGHQITVLADKEKLQKILDMLFSETSTIGVRFSKVERYKLPRQTKTVHTKYGDVRIKIAKWKKLTKISPEFDDCQKLAQELGLPLKQVYEAAKIAAQDQAV